jgi:histone H1/5
MRALVEDREELLRAVLGSLAILAAAAVSLASADTPAAAEQARRQASLALVGLRAILVQPGLLVGPRARAEWAEAAKEVERLEQKRATAERRQARARQDKAELAARARRQAARAKRAARAAARAKREPAEREPAVAAAARAKRERARWVKEASAEAGAPAPARSRAARRTGRAGR